MRPVRLLTVIATLGFVACGDSTGVVGDLTEAEATELAAVVFATAFASAAAAPEGPPPQVGPQLVPYDYTREAEFTAECELDGTVSAAALLEIEGDTESEAGRIEYTMTLVHEGCTAASPNEVVFTLDGAPDLTVHLVAENDGQGSIVLESTLEGSIDWSAEGRDGGTCEIALAVTGAIDQTAGTIELDAAGIVCRFTISESVSVG
jgi:hypothetical protein